MKHDLKITMVVEKGEQGWFIGQIAELPGVLTQGKTIEETKENLLDALELYLEAQRQDRLGKNEAEVARENLVIG